MQASPGSGAEHTRQLSKMRNEADAQRLTKLPSCDGEYKNTNYETEETHHYCGIARRIVSRRPQHARSRQSCGYEGEAFSAENVRRDRRGNRQRPGHEAAHVHSQRTGSETVL